jgi:hypothetical protein
MRSRNRSKRTALTDSDLRDYSIEHLRYEVSMLFDTGSALPYPTSPMVGFADNAILESFAIHLRNLLDFFYPGLSPQDNDVIAANYYDAGHLPTNFPAQSNQLKRAERRAHKELSHLTTERIAGRPPEKAWTTGPLLQEMVNLIQVFAATASAQKLHPDFCELVRQFKVPNPTTVKAMQAADRGEGKRYKSVDDFLKSL